MAVDWYASKNAWMTGDIYHRIMTKFNNQMRKAGCHVLYVCDNTSSHQVQEYSNIEFLMLPPNATSIVQPLDQGIIHSVKRRYQKKLAERYLVSVVNNKDANTILKQLDFVAATNMVHNAWKETSATIIQNCFRKAGFIHHTVIQMQHQRRLLLPQPPMCGIKFRDGWVMCSLMTYNIAHDRQGDY